MLFFPSPVFVSCRLVAFVVVLALANLGTSFASAILAKDTTTRNGQLVDKNTNEAVATAAAVETYAVGEDDGDNTRKLAECTTTSTSAGCESTVATATTMSSTKALALLKNCYENKNVKLQLISGSTVTQTTVCGVGLCGSFTSSYTMNGNGVPVDGALCIPGSTTGEKLIVKRKTGSTTTYTLSRNMFATTAPTRASTRAPTTAPPTMAAVTTTLAPGQCFNTTDCTGGMVCEPPPLMVVDEGFFAAVMPQTCTSNKDCSDGKICYQGTCGACDSTSCSTNSEKPVCIVPVFKENKCGCTDDTSCGNGEICGIPFCHIKGRYAECVGTCIAA